MLGKTSYKYNMMFFIRCYTGLKKWNLRSDFEFWSKFTLIFISVWSSNVHGIGYLYVTYWLFPKFQTFLLFVVFQKILTVDTSNI